MRRVIDDTHLEEVVDEIENIVKYMPADEVTVYSGGYRVDIDKVVDYIFDHINIPVKLGGSQNHTGIGNNWKHELIWAGDPKEEQICGVLCLLIDPRGPVIFFINDIDGQKVSNTRIIYGLTKEEAHDSPHLRFSGWGEDIE